MTTAYAVMILAIGSCAACSHRTITARTANEIAQVAGIQPATAITWTVAQCEAAPHFRSTGATVSLSG